MSRIILVHASHRGKKIPPSKSYVKTELEEGLGDMYKHLFYDFRKPLIMSKSAIKLEDEIYNQEIKVPDTRFVFYAMRRHTHLEKVAMVLAATNQRATIEQKDIELAHEILLETEKQMPDALGEYGLSPIALGRQKMVEFIQHANGPVNSDILWAMMRRDMRLVDFKNAVADLVNGHKLIKVETDDGLAFVYNEDLSQVFNELIDEPQQKKET